MRRHLEMLLFAGGLLLASWPVITWAYGVYWQDRLAREWSTPRASPAAMPRAAEAPRKTARTVRGRKTFARLRIARIGLEKWREAKGPNPRLYGRSYTPFGLIFWSNCESPERGPNADPRQGCFRASE